MGTVALNWATVYYSLRVADMSTQLIGDIEAQASSENRTVAKQPTGSDAFTDLWLRHHLTQLYGNVAKEPLPDDLLALLEERLD
jgi:hypothetical protein